MSSLEAVKGVGSIESTSPIRVGVVLADLGALNLAPLKYLVLQLNTLQRYVAFEFVPAPAADPLLTTLAHGRQTTWSDFYAQRQSFAARARLQFETESAEYELTESPPAHWVVVSLASLEDGYYFAHGEEVSLIALGDWKRDMAPPSLLEYLLTLLIVEALEVAAPTLGAQPFHLGTKGCVRDFNADVRDIKFKALSGYLCEQCRQMLRGAGQERIAAEFESILGKRWLGDLADPYAPAHIAANLGYNLFAVKGIVPTFMETLRAKLNEETVKLVLSMCGAIILAALLLKLGLK